MILYLLNTAILKNREFLCGFALILTLSSCANRTGSIDILTEQEKRNVGHAQVSIFVAPPNYLISSELPTNLVTITPDGVLLAPLALVTNHFIKKGNRSDALKTKEVRKQFEHRFDKKGIADTLKQRIKHGLEAVVWLPFASQSNAKVGVNEPESATDRPTLAFEPTFPPTPLSASPTTLLSIIADFALSPSLDELLLKADLSLTCFQELIPPTSEIDCDVPLLRMTILSRTPLAVPTQVNNEVNRILTDALTKTSNLSIDAMQKQKNWREKLKRANDDTLDSDEQNSWRQMHIHDESYLRSNFEVAGVELAAMIVAALQLRNTDGFDDLVSGKIATPVNWPFSATASQRVWLRSSNSRIVSAENYWLAVPKSRSHANLKSMTNEVLEWLSMAYQDK